MDGAEDLRQRVPNFLLIVLILTMGCASTRTHMVTRDESGLNELEEAIGTSKVTIHSAENIYRDAEITSFSRDSITFVVKKGLGIALVGSMSIDSVHQIVDERSGWGIVWGALAGAIGGGMIGGLVGGTSYAPRNSGGFMSIDMGAVDAAITGAVIGGGIGLMVGGAIGNALDKDDVYTLEEPK